MLEGLYDRDILIWSEQQAALLRRMATGERLNDAVDWENLIEEVEAVGRSELHACESKLRQALVHLLKMQASPRSRATGHWRSETVGFLAGAQEAFTPSMRQRIELERLYQKALNQVRAGFAGNAVPPPLPVLCPFSLDDLLAGDPDITTLMVKLATATSTDTA